MWNILRLYYSYLVELNSMFFNFLLNYRKKYNDFVETSFVKLLTIQRKTHTR